MDSDITRNIVKNEENVESVSMNAENKHKNITVIEDVETAYE